MFCSQWNLVCSRSSLANVSQSMYFFGWVIGCWLFGWMADQIGRRKVTLFCFLGLIVCAFVSVLAPTYTIYAVSRFGLGFFISGGMTFFVLTCEIVGAGYRSVVMAVASALFAISFVVVAGTAYFLTHWRVFLLFAAASSAMFILCWGLVGCLQRMFVLL